MTDNLGNEISAQEAAEDYRRQLQMSAIQRNSDGWVKRDDFMSRLKSPRGLRSLAHRFMQFGHSREKAQMLVTHNLSLLADVPVGSDYDLPMERQILGPMVSEIE